MTPTPYRYIQNYYGKAFMPGDRVRLEGATPRFGTVMRPKLSHLHYVRVKFDETGPGLCHPNSIEILTPENGS